MNDSTYSKSVEQLYGIVRAYVIKNNHVALYEDFRIGFTWFGFYDEFELAKAAFDKANNWVDTKIKQLKENEHQGQDLNKAIDEHERRFRESKL